MPLIDGHNDYPWALRENAGRDLDKLDITKPQPTIMTDIARLRAGGVGGQFWSVYVSADDPAPVTTTLEQIDIVYRMMRSTETFELALTADDVERIFKKGKIASLIGMEGGHSIDSSLGALRMFQRLGARYMTLTHSKNTPWADSATDKPALNGLSPFGEQVVSEMNWLGMLVDLSHVSPDTMKDAIAVSEAPVVFLALRRRVVTDVPRNVPDDALQLLPKNGGVVMVTFVPGFLSAKVAQHNRERRLVEAANSSWQSRGQRGWTAGTRTPRPARRSRRRRPHRPHQESRGHRSHRLGGDFDGITSVPLGLEDVSKYPALTAELRGAATRMTRSRRSSASTSSA